MFKRKSKANAGLAATGPKIVPLRKRSHVTVIDFEGTLARVVQASGQGTSARITRIAQAPLELAAGKKDDPKVFGAALRTALEALKIKAKEVIFTVPRGQAVLRPLQVPLIADLRELASIINFQVSRELPFRIEEAVVDFKVLRTFAAPRAADAGPSTAPEQTLEVLVGAVKREVIDFYRAVATEAGLKVDGLGLRPIGHSQFARQSGALPADSTALIIGLRTDETTLDVIEGEKLVFSRAASPTFSEDKETQPGFVQALVIEAIRGLHSYHGTVQKILVLGATGLEKEVASALSAKFDLPIEFPSLAGADPEQSGSAAACGLALAALDVTGLTLDFENPKKPAAPRNTRRTQGIIAAAAAVVLLFSLFGLRAHLIKKRTALKQSVQTELTDAEKKLPTYRRLKAQSKVVNGWMAEEQSWLNHLAFLGGILPAADEIYLSAFATTPQHVIRFSVQAKSGELLAELDKKLRQAGYEVRPLSITPANDRHGYNFRTTVELTIPKKMKPAHARVKPPARPPDDTPSGSTNAAAAKEVTRS